MSTDRIGYEALMQEAMRGIVRRALECGADGSLPGAHHFYISFKTRFPGVDLDESLAQAYPEDMTIVLEHQFWDLGIDDEGFEVTLKFNRVPKYIRIPWAAITAFQDPSVGFGLKFEVEVPAAPEIPIALPGPKVVSIDTAREPGEAQVVSLDAFRRKPPGGGGAA